MTLVASPSQLLVSAHLGQASRSRGSSNPRVQRHDVRTCWLRASADQRTSSADTSWLGKVWSPLPPLHRASRRGDRRKVKELLESGVPVDQRDRDGSTALMHASEKKKVAVVEALLSAGASIDAANRCGFTPFLYAAKGGDTLGSRRVLRLIIAVMNEDQKAALGPLWMRVGSTDKSMASFDGTGSSEELTGQDELSAWVKTKAADAAETWQVMMQSTDEVAVGGHVIAGKTADMMGVLDGQRYKLERLFYRPSGDLKEGEPRFDVRLQTEPPPEDPPPQGSQGWELWAEISSTTWMPWGSTEVRAACWGTGGEANRWRCTEDHLSSERNPKQLVEGDIVLFNPPPLLVQYVRQNGDRLSSRDKFVKRVVGIPGDTVSTNARAQVFVNGVLQEGLSPSGASCSSCRPPDYEIDSLSVPEGQLLVLGDNRGASADSHVWGFLPRESVEGRVLWRILPTDRFSPLGRTVDRQD